MMTLFMWRLQKNNTEAGRTVLAGRPTRSLIVNKLASAWLVLCPQERRRWTRPPPPTSLPPPPPHNKPPTRQVRGTRLQQCDLEVRARREAWRSLSPWTRQSRVTKHIIFYTWLICLFTQDLFPLLSKTPKSFRFSRRANLRCSRKTTAQFQFYRYEAESFRTIFSCVSRIFCGKQHLLSRNQ